MCWDPTPNPPPPSHPPIPDSPPHPPGTPPPLPLQCLRLPATILLRHLRRQEDLSFKILGRPSAGPIGGPWEEGGPSQTPLPPPQLLTHPEWGGGVLGAASQPEKPPPPRGGMPGMLTMGASASECSTRHHRAIEVIPAVSGVWGSRGGGGGDCALECRHRRCSRPSRSPFESTLVLRSDAAVARSHTRIRWVRDKGL